MIPGDKIQAELESDDADTHLMCESAGPQSNAKGHDVETAEDEAWLNACRQELEDDEDAPIGASDETKNDPDRSHQQPEDDENSASPYGSEPGAAITKTGDDAMSKFGHAIGALAEREEDFDDQALDYAAEIAKPSSKRDEAVAPHIAAAERELERSKNSGPSDIFDRIAQAAESQFDESRGSTAKRVSELVDDRRVGTKRWTPSKTMKQRMEKLEAARASGSGTAPSSNAAAGVAAVAGAAAVAASAPSSSTATMVTPDTKSTADTEPTEAKAQTQAEQTVEKLREPVSSQEQQQPELNETVGSASTEAEAVPADVEDEHADNLRIIPGARGRRRDRARKSRLDEDFEKIFDDEGKPSINSLRRKLRSTASAEAEEATSGQSQSDAADGTSDLSEPKKGLFSRLLQSKAKKPTEQVETALESEDDLVAAFAEDKPQVDENLVIDPSLDESWEEAIDTENKQSKLARPIIGLGAMIALAGIGFFAYKFLTG